jgi:hypothetical protein
MINFLSGSSIDSALIKQIIKKDVRFGHLDDILPREEVKKVVTVVPANHDAKGSKPASTEKSKPGKDSEKTDSKVETKKVLVVPEEYRKNEALYEVWLNTYFFLLEDRCGTKFLEIQQAVTTRLKQRGLIEYIKDSCKFFDNFCYEGEIGEDTLFTPLLKHILSTEYPDLMGVQVAAQIFRYGKRFSPFGNSHLAAECEQAFWRCEQINRENDKEEIPWFWVQRVQQTIREFIPEMLDEDSADNSGRLYLSPNSVQDICKCRLCKYILLDSYLGNDNPYISKSMQEELLDDIQEGRYAIWDEVKQYGSGFEYIDPRITVGTDFTQGHAVPKNWKAFRMVGSEQVSKYHEQMKLEQELRRCSEKTISLGWRKVDNRCKGGFSSSRFEEVSVDLAQHIPISDQSLQRDRAFEGSLSAKVDTWDLSSASDLHRKSVVRSIYPNDTANQLCKHVPKGMIVGDKKGTLKMFAPMGSPLTFRTMGDTLWAILLTVTLFVASLCRWDASRLILAISRSGVYGDDCACDSEVSEIFARVVEYFGFILNYEKSCFHSGKRLFREACGGDYYDGIDITTAYWPRKQLDILHLKAVTPRHINGFDMADDDPVTTLIEHSKAIRKFSVKAASYLNMVIMKHIPEMTTSDIGSSNPDLWASFPIAKTVRFSPHILPMYRHRRDYGLVVDEGIWMNGAILPMDMAYKVGKEILTKKLVNVGGKLRYAFEGHFEKLPFVVEPKSKEFIRDFAFLAPNDPKSCIELTCTPIPQFKRKQLSDNCAVERMLKKYNLDVDAILDFYSYLQETSSASRYEDGLMELLHIPEQFNQDSMFCDPTLRFVRK